MANVTETHGVNGWILVRIESDTEADVAEAKADYLIFWPPAYGTSFSDEGCVAERDASLGPGPVIFYAKGRRRNKC